MCLHYMFYYPRMTDLTLCESVIFEPSLKLMDKYLLVLPAQTESFARMLLSHFVGAVSFK